MRLEVDIYIYIAPYPQLLSEDFHTSRGMLELRGQNGLLEGSCVETCGMPSSHSASWRVHAVPQRWKMLFYIFGIHFTKSMFLFFFGGGNIFFNQVSDMTVFFLKTEHQPNAF